MHKLLQRRVAVFTVFLIVLESSSKGRGAQSVNRAGGKIGILFAFLMRNSRQLHSLISAVWYQLSACTSQVLRLKKFYLIALLSVCLCAVFEDRC